MAVQSEIHVKEPPIQEDLGNLAWLKLLMVTCKRKKLFCTRKINTKKSVLLFTVIEKEILQKKIKLCILAMLLQVFMNRVDKKRYFILFLCTYPFCTNIFNTAVMATYMLLIYQKLI